MQLAILQPNQHNIDPHRQHQHKQGVLPVHAISGNLVGRSLNLPRGRLVRLLRARHSLLPFTSILVIQGKEKNYRISIISTSSSPRLIIWIASPSMMPWTYASPISL